MEQEAYNQNLENAQTAGLAGQAANQAMAASQGQYVIEEKEKNLAEAQLECDKTLRDIYHRLRQDDLVLDKGKMVWKSIPDEQRILVDAGVNKIMKVMKSYINKETLLSNFDADQIKTRMLRFCTALNDNLYMRYEHYFRFPTIQECKTELETQIKKKIEMKVMSLEILGEEVDEEEIKREVLEQYGSSMEDEIKTIMKIKRNENLREFELLFVELEALVEATHNRAFRGEERGSLRRHFNISEVIGSNPQAQQVQGGFLGKFRR